MSRSTDDKGNIQPTRTAVLQGRAVGTFYHNNGIQAWHVNDAGEVSNVYA
jgi:sulfane dehydrogenase subunit SoxC